MAASEHAHELTSNEYIQHHLTNWTFGHHPTEGWMVAHTQQQAAEMGFNAIHLDSMLWSIGLGVLFCGLFYTVAKRATAGVPGKLQAFIEMIVEFVDSNVRDAYHGKSKLVAPLALTIFVWIFLMNLMDLIPIDFIPVLAQKIGAAMGHDPHHVYMKIVPSTDPNVTLGMSFSVLALIIYFAIKEKGVGGFIGDLTLHPFSASNPVAKALLQNLLRAQHGKLCYLLTQVFTRFVDFLINRIMGLLANTLTFSGCLNARVLKHLVGTTIGLVD